MKDLITALAFGIEGNLSVPRDQEFAHAALRIYGAMLATQTVTTIDPMQFPEEPAPFLNRRKAAPPRDVPVPRVAAPRTPAPRRQSESYAPGKRDLYEMLRQAVVNTPAAKEDGDGGNR